MLRRGVLASVLASGGILLAPAAVLAEDAKTGTLILTMTGFESEKGEVLVQLCDSKADYAADDGGFRVVRLQAKDGKAGHRFEDIPYGEYALKIFHDENSNEELDIGWMGPEERYGFSNGVRGMMGPPDWEEAKFTFDEPEQTAQVEVK